jgi:hypothetical protein
MVRAGLEPHLDHEHVLLDHVPDLIRLQGGHELDHRDVERDGRPHQITHRELTVG